VAPLEFTFDSAVIEEIAFVDVTIPSGPILLSLKSTLISVLSGAPGSIEFRITSNLIKNLDRLAA
jgi:hypothetical protein